VVHRRRRANPRRYYARHRRRNPALFGARVTGGQMATAVVAGLVGVAGVKFVPTLLPAGMVTGGIMRTIVSGVSAFVLQFIARKVGVSETLSSAVLFGGLMQTGSVAINAVLPGTLATRLALGELVPGSYPAPFNPVKAGAPVMIAPGKGVSALQRTAFPGRY
jgi:hypothetical protein